MNSLNTAKKSLTVVQGAANYSALTDAELVVFCKNNDEKAFNTLVRRHQRTVFGLLLRLAPDWNDTADLAQEVFIRVWRGIDNLKNPNAFKSWLSQVATHLFYDELRKRPRRTPVISLDQSMFGDDDTENQTRDIADSSAGPEELLERKELDKELRSAIATLPRQFRTAIVLRELEDMSYEEIAQVTKTDLGTVKSRISRARTKVQQVLRPQFGGGRRSIA